MNKRAQYKKFEKLNKMILLIILLCVLFYCNLIFAQPLIAQDQKNGARFLAVVINGHTGGAVFPDYHKYIALFFAKSNALEAWNEQRAVPEEGEREFLLTNNSLEPDVFYFWSSDIIKIKSFPNKTGKCQVWITKKKYGPKNIITNVIYNSDELKKNNLEMKRCMSYGFLAHFEFDKLMPFEAYLNDINLPDLTGDYAKFLSTTSATKRD
jgi:hypothetical protein